MAQAGYNVTTEGAVTLTAATARSVLGVKAHTNSGLQVKGFKVGFAGVTASAVPVLIELCYSTWATKSPGTNSTSVTARQTYGRSLTAGFTAASSWAAANEPTVLTVVEEFLLSPNGGLFVMQYPLGTEPDCALAEGYVLRCTAPAGVDVRGTMSVERI